MLTPEVKDYIYRFVLTGFLIVDLTIIYTVVGMYLIGLVR